MITTTVVVKEHLRVLVGDTLSDIYRKLRNISGKEEEELFNPVNKLMATNHATHQQTHSYRQ